MGFYTLTARAVRSRLRKTYNPVSSVYTSAYILYGRASEIIRFQESNQLKCVQPYIYKLIKLEMSICSDVHYTERVFRIDPPHCPSLVVAKTKSWQTLTLIIRELSRFGSKRPTRKRIYNKKHTHIHIAGVRIPFEWNNIIIPCIYYSNTRFYYQNISLNYLSRTIFAN